MEQEGASIVICEADGRWPPVFDLPLLAVGSARGDPTNVDVAAATPRAIPVLHAPVAMPTAWPSSPSGCCSP